MLRIGLAVLTLLALATGALAQTPPDWQRVSGPLTPTPTVPPTPGTIDGIAGDRENSYAWSMEVYDGYLYVGVVRNVFSFMLQMAAMIGVPPQNPWAVPVPDSTRPPCSAISRMRLGTTDWEQFYPSPAAPGCMSGYRMMKTYRAPDGREVLYAGTIGYMGASLLAIDHGAAPVTVFSAPRWPGAPMMRQMSIRGIAEHDGELFWASEDAQGKLAIWHSPDPLGELQRDPNVVFPKILIDTRYYNNLGEITDLISYGGWLYAFFTTDKTDGFWVAKTKFRRGAWEWQLVVGDEALGARYAAGVGRPSNGVGTPFRFKNHVYVGTFDAAAWRMMNGVMPTITPPVNIVDMMGGAVGMQVFRFDQRDTWERVMPDAALTGEAAEAASGLDNPYTKYIWRFGAVDGFLYAGTFDIGTGLFVISGFLPPGPSLKPGFDLYRTRDGETWEPVTIDGFGDFWNYGARSFVSDPATGDLYMGTANPFYGCQVWRRPAMPEPPGSGRPMTPPGEGREARPGAVEFGLAGPNPARLGATVQLGLAARAYVRLAVYDAAGRLVRTLVDGEREPGRSSVTWDLRDEQSRAVANGLFFVWLDVDGQRHVQRVAVMR